MRTWILPTPFEWFVIHICQQAALTSAFAPLFGGDPSAMAVPGLYVGFVTGLPFYVAFAFRRRSK